MGERSTCLSTLLVDWVLATRLSSGSLFWSVAIFSGSYPSTDISIVPFLFWAGAMYEIIRAWSMEEGVCICCIPESSQSIVLLVLMDFWMQQALKGCMVLAWEKLQEIRYLQNCCMVYSQPFLTGNAVISFEFWQLHQYQSYSHLCAPQICRIVDGTPKQNILQVLPSAIWRSFVLWNFEGSFDALRWFSYNNKALYESTVVSANFISGSPKHVSKKD